MKKILLGAFACCGLLLMTSSVNAQTSFRFGIKAGGSLNYSKITYDGQTTSGDSRFGFYGGGLIEMSPTDPGNQFKIQLEALYSRVNFRYDDPQNSTSLARLSLNQINVPILGKLFVTPRFSLNLGPTLNFNLSGKGTLETNEVVTEKKHMTDFNSFQMGLAAGATYYIHKGFFVDARYTPLFGSVTETADGLDGAHLKTSAIKLGLGYKF